MGNRGAEWAFFSAFDIGVNPLMIACGVCERVDHFLSDGHPFGRAEIGAGQIGDVLRNETTVRA